MIGEAIREALGRPLESALDLLTDAHLSGRSHATFKFDIPEFTLMGELLSGTMAISVRPRGVMNVVESMELETALLRRCRREPGEGHVSAKTAGVFVVTWRPQR